MIFLRSGNYFIKDLNSANGTLLNNIPVHESILKTGDIIQIGEVRLEFQSKLKRPELQIVSRAEVKKPLNSKGKASKSPEFDVTRALRITDELKSTLKGLEGSKKTVSKAAKKQILFFGIAIFALLAIAFYAYLQK